MAIAAVTVVMEGQPEVFQSAVRADMMGSRDNRDHQGYKELKRKTRSWLLEELQGASQALLKNKALRNPMPDSWNTCFCQELSTLTL
jgi:hypothetical protein